MKPSKRPQCFVRNTAFATLSAVGLILGGCGGGDDAPPEDAGAATAPADNTAAAAKEKPPEKPARESVTFAKKWPAGKKLVYKKTVAQKSTSEMNGQQIPFFLDRSATVALNVPNANTAEAEILGVSFKNANITYDTHTSGGDGPDADVDMSEGADGDPSGGAAPGAGGGPRTITGMQGANGAKLQINAGPDGNVISINGAPQATARLQAGMPAQFRIIGGDVFNPAFLKERYLPLHENLDGAEAKLNTPWSGTVPYPVSLSTNMMLKYTNTVTAFGTKDGRETAEVTIAGVLEGQLAVQPGQTAELTSTVAGKLTYDIELGVVVDSDVDISYTRRTLKGTAEVFKQTGTYKIVLNVSQVLAAGSPVGGGGDGMDGMDGSI